MESRPGCFSAKGAARSEWAAASNGAVRGANRVASKAAGKATVAAVGSLVAMDKLVGRLAEDILHIRAEVVAVGTEAEKANSEGQKLQVRLARKIQAV